MHSYGKLKTEQRKYYSLSKPIPVLGLNAKIRRAEGGGTHIRLSLFGARTRPPLCGSFFFAQKLKTHLAAGISDFRLEPQLKWHPPVKYIFVLLLRNQNADTREPRKKSLYFFPNLRSYFL